MEAEMISGARQFRARPACGRCFERDALAHLGRLYSLALLITGDSLDAEELVDKTFAAVDASFHQLPIGADLKPWLYRILITTCRRTRRPEPPPMAAADLANRAPADAMPQPRSGPGAALIEALRRIPDPDVKEALDQLPEDVRIIVYLADVEGETYAEIADIIGTPMLTVTSRLHHGRRQLRDRLQEYATTSGLAPR
jgi:RNA polymerase sigma-70 factor (ECF subfamily)